MENLEPAMERLNNVFQAASEEMYNAANAGVANPTGEQASDDAANAAITDVDFEEVDDKNKEFTLRMKKRLSQKGSLFFYHFFGNIHCQFIEYQYI
ncbi:MAG: hypothetical protein KA734_01555 [Fluviicola sp.]|nr:hypothetical protein [Fluviicola sp.]